MNKTSTIVIFACNWDGLTCIESAAQKRLTFSSSVKIIRVSCLSRVDTGLILQAFEYGADGVVMLGCDSRSCHFGIEESLINQNFEKAKELMRILGLKQNRIELIRLPHGDSTGFINKVNDFVEQFLSIT
jgi:F420-non-reducing hydrogenase iron-sulfur subunit